MFEKKVAQMGKDGLKYTIWKNEDCNNLAC